MPSNLKYEILISKQNPILQTINPSKYDLKDRTYFFAERVNEYVNRISKTISNIENEKQMVKSSGSIGANDIEANESISKKDFWWE